MKPIRIIILLSAFLLTISLAAGGCGPKAASPQPTPLTPRPSPLAPSALPTAPLNPAPTTIQSPTASPPTATAATYPTRPPTQSPTPRPPTATATTTSASTILARLEGLSIDTFYEASFKQWMLRDPETITILGLAKVYGTRNDQLTNISDAYIRETQALESGILARLQKYDRAALTPAQQLTYDIYAWWLDDRVHSHEFMYDDYPVNQFIFGVNYAITQYFTDLRPLENKQDALDYLTALSQVDTKFEQLLDNLKRREAAGVILPRFLVQQTLADLQNTALSTARATSFYTSFADKVNQLADIDDTERKTLLAAAEKEVSTSVLPAFQSIAAYFEHLETVATNDAGVWKFPNGDAYYNYTLRHYTTTELTADQIHELGNQELERIHTEMRTIFNQLGYPKDATLADLYGRVAREGGIIAGGEVLAYCASTLQAALQKVSPVFDLLPKAKVICMGGPLGGFYMPSAIDGSRPGMYYVGEYDQSKSSLQTTIYHETIPGHHFQIAITQELNLPSLRKGMDFNAYTEGWALYAERLVSELGFYENDPYGDLGRLQLEAFRATRLVVDTGLHAKQWTFDQAVNFMIENTGRGRGGSEYEISRYLVLPGQSTSYYIGYLKILALRQKAKDALGNQFDLKEFHNIILSVGAVPLSVLEQVVNNYIEAKKSK